MRPRSFDDDDPPGGGWSLDLRDRNCPYGPETALAAIAKLCLIIRLRLRCTGSPCH